MKLLCLSACAAASLAASSATDPNSSARSLDTCDATKDFPVDLTGFQYLGLNHKQDAKDVQACAQACCDDGASCNLWQFSKTGCWVGKASSNPTSDPEHEYQSRGRNMPAPPKPPPPPKSPYVVTDAGGLGLRWEGVGAISGGGATSKLLMDYPRDKASDILDFLFKPNFGLNLQLLKVELGGDTDATEGAEPSHMHAGFDDEDYNRGYEWWLMKEARARNPDIKLYGLPWGWPGFLDPSATADQQAKNAFVHPNVTANYTLAWLRGAKQVHGLDIDYIGQWNERDAPAAYNQALRDLVAKDDLVSSTTCLDRLPHYPGTTDKMDSQGCKQYDWNTTDGSRWVDEEGSIFDGRSARCLARCLNRNYISGCHTATFQWHLVSSFYDYLPWARCGVAVANTPWSGHYEITSPTWALAHTSQFAPVGWRYAQHGYGVTMLEKGGSMVTRVSPDLADFSIVIEKMDSANSVCARGSNPSSVSEAEEVILILNASFKTAAGSHLQVWYSNLTSGSDIDVNPPDSQLFQNLGTVPVAANGTVRLQVKPNDIYTLTTLTTGGKGTHAIPDDKPFPLPYSQDFDNEVHPAPAALWYDQMGAWEIQADPTAGGVGSNQVMRQVTPVWPACWGYSCTGPTTYFGPSSFNGSTAVSVDVYLEDHAAFTLQAQGKCNIGVVVDTKGTYAVVDGKKTLGSGPANFSVNSWHTLQLDFGKEHTVALLDDNVLYNGTDAAADGWHLMAQLDRYIYASMDNFKIWTIDAGEV